LDIHQLDLFLAVLDSPSLTRAAEQVFLSPGAVSLQLHNLSAELRTELFVKSGKRLVPTPAAFRLAEHARQITRQMQDIRREFENDPVSDTRPFHFATGPTTLIHRLGRPLRALRKQYPNTEIHVMALATEEIVAGLLDRRFDLGLISLPVQEERLEITPLYEEELLILRPSPTRVRGSHVGNIKPADLARVPFVLYPMRSNMRSLIDSYLREIDLTPHVVMEADDTETIKGLVESGFGCSILPEYALRGPTRFFHTYRVPGHRLVRQQALATARTGYPRALTRSIASSLQAALGK
jgi:DNA-binding transcriptional LysR family regulator